MEKNLLIISCLTGFAGDFLLQIGAKLGLGGPTGWGLNEYFKQHNSIESLFIAGGMMTLFYVIFILSKIPINYTNLAIYGVILDFLFRKLMIFKSLKGYYTWFNYFWSAVWGAIPMMLPLFIFQRLDTFH
jgi:hypothetical protein